jgi:hypothetical protein
MTTERNLFMKIDEFIKGYNGATDKKGFINLHVVRKYLPYEEKVVIANAIVKSFTNKETGDFVRNTPAVFMNEVVSLVREYTDIEIGKNESLDVFNKIEKNNITELLVDAIGSDAQRLQTVISMVVNDAVANHGDLVNFMSLKSDNVNVILDKLKDALAALPQK